MPWLDRPQYQPYEDIQGVSGKDNGPYLEFDFHYRKFDPHNPNYYDEHVHRLYLSAATLKHFIEEGKNPPFLLANANSYNELVKDHHECVERIAELEKANDSLAAKVIEADVKAKDIKALVEEASQATKNQMTAKARAARKKK